MSWVQVYVPKYCCDLAHRHEMKIDLYVLIPNNRMWEYLKYPIQESHVARTPAVKPVTPVIG